MEEHAAGDGDDVKRLPRETRTITANVNKAINIMKIKYVIAGAVKMEVKTADDLVTAVDATLCVCEAREIRVRSSQLAYNRRSHAKISAHY